MVHRMTARQPGLGLWVFRKVKGQVGRQRQVWLIPISDEHVGVHCAGNYSQIP